MSGCRNGCDRPFPRGCSDRMHCACSCHDIEKDYARAVRAIDHQYQRLMDALHPREALFRTLNMGMERE